jgi:hypothetical protein
MAELGAYSMTHAPPNNTELALLNTFIDQRVAIRLLRHKTRMFELLHQNPLIARSVVEHRFLSRMLLSSQAPSSPLTRDRHTVHVC